MRMCSPDHGVNAGMCDTGASVIIPAHNAEGCLAECLDSVLAQTLPPHEVIAINDGSTDGTAAVARRYGDRITYIEQQNTGQGAARNAGLRVATGKHIAFLDADDYWLSGFLQATVAFLEQTPEAVAVSTGCVIRRADGREVQHPAFLNDRQSVRAPGLLDDFFAFWAEHDHVRTGSVLMRASAVARAGLQREDLRVSQDLEYWAMLGTVGPWGLIPEPLWVGNSRAAARGFAWIRKYRKRRALCPTVESWEQRVLPRLTPAQEPHFRVVRGRVATGYAHNMVLAGRCQDARHTVKKYGQEMPANRVSRLLITGDRLGSLGWHLVCRLAQAREYAKAFGLAV